LVYLIENIALYIPIKFQNNQLMAANCFDDTDILKLFIKSVNFSCHRVVVCLSTFLLLDEYIQYTHSSTGRLVPAASIWFENWGFVGPGLKSGVVSGPKISTK